MDFQQTWDGNSYAEDNSGYYFDNSSYAHFGQDSNNFYYELPSPSSNCSSWSPSENISFFSDASEAKVDEASKEEKALKKKNGSSGAIQKPLSEAVRKKRRLDANARERKRMTGLNEAFARLRTVLGCNRDRPLSKMEALQMAQQRIAELNEMLLSP